MPTVVSLAESDDAIYTLAELADAGKNEALSNADIDALLYEQP